MNSRHQEAKKLSSLFNSTDGSLIELKNRLRDMEISPAIKENLEQFVQHINLSRMVFSAEELQSLKALIDMKINMINEKREILDVFFPEDGVKRFVRKGEYFAGMMNGKGEYIDYDPQRNVGVYYAGSMQNDQMNGQGTCWEIYSDRSVELCGEWRQNQLWNGEKRSRLCNGTTIVAKVSNGIPDFSYVFNQNQKLVYVGELVNDEKEGIGEEINPEGETIEYIGSFVQGKREGYGTSFDRRGSVQYKGEWRQGHFMKNQDGK